MLRQIQSEFDLADFNQWLESSSKIKFVFKLLENLKAEGHRVLIFSKSKMLLNMVQDIMAMRDYTYVRLDGDTKIMERDGVCRRFNQDRNIFVFLLTA